MAQQISARVFVLVVVLVAPSVEARQHPTASMADMMMHCRASSESIDQVTRIIGDASGSDDPAMMRAALQEAQKRLPGLQQQMSSCMSMMGGMNEMRPGPESEGTSGMMQPETQGMMGGMVCCPPAGVAGVLAVTIGGLLALSLAAALVALTVFLLKRSQTPRATT